MVATAIEVKTAYGAGQGGVADHAHDDHPPTSTGLNHRKILMWVFLASDTMAGYVTGQILEVNGGQYMP